MFRVAEEGAPRGKGLYVDSSIEGIAMICLLNWELPEYLKFLAICSHAHAVEPPWSETAAVTRKANAQAIQKQATRVSFQAVLRGVWSMGLLWGLFCISQMPKLAFQVSGSALQLVSEHAACQRTEVCYVISPSLITAQGFNYCFAAIRQPRKK